MSTRPRSVADMRPQSNRRARCARPAPQDRPRARRRGPGLSVLLSWRSRPPGFGRDVAGGAATTEGERHVPIRNAVGLLLENRDADAYNNLMADECVFVRHQTGTGMQSSTPPATAWGGRAGPHAREPADEPVDHRLPEAAGLGGRSLGQATRDQLQTCTATAYRSRACSRCAPARVQRWSADRLILSRIRC